MSYHFHVQDAARLCQNIVANYGMSKLGITTYAPPTGGALGFMQKSFEVSVDNIDADLFGRGIRGGFFQPSDQSLHELRTAMYDIMREAYAEVQVCFFMHCMPCAMVQARQELLKCVDGNAC
jgi:hypothetical protein